MINLEAMAAGAAQPHLLQSAADWATTGRPPARGDFEPGLRGGRFDFEMAAWLWRADYISGFGFSIPCAEAIEALSAFTPILEVGAGTGFWSAILAARGVDVVATDKHAGQSSYGYEIGAQFPINRLGAAAAIRAYPARTVFCSWPCYRVPWFARALALVRPGVAVAVVHEGRGGCVGTEGLFARLEAGFDEVEQIALPNFPGIRDRLTVWRRRPVDG